jgi:exopolysaccharide production protein ExoZ
MIRNIQALRVLAVYLVFLQHSTETLALAGINVAHLNFGRAGVDIFFVISGFIMVITTDTRETRPLNFALHRILRIVPIYWLITLLLFAGTLVIPHLLRAPDAAPGTLAKSLFFIPDQRSDGSVMPILFVGWTLNYEMFFYLLFTFSLFIRQRTIRLATMIAVLAVLAIAGAAAPAKNVPAAFYTDPIMLEFGAGILLGAFWSRMPSVGRWAPLALLAVALGFTLLVLQPTFWPNITRSVSFGLPALLIVGCALLLEKSGWSVKAGWLMLLGNASYSIYLTHSFVTAGVYKVAARLHFHSAAPVGVTILISVALVAAAGILTHWYAEKPLIAFFKPRLFPASGKVTA